MKLKALNRFAKPSRIEFRQGDIVVSILGDFELPTTDQGKALLPSSNNYYKIIDIHPGGIGVKLLNLYDGSLSIKSNT